MNQFYRFSLLLVLLFAGCSSAPEISYYSFPIETSPPKSADNNLNLAIEPFVGDAAYDNPRMVYRTSPYKLDYYYYHRWASEPSRLLADLVRADFAQSGKFHSVTLGYSASANVVLTGRIIALDQIEYEGAWKARVGIDFSLHPSGSSDVIWNEPVVREVEMLSHKPEAFAVAATEATHAIVEAILPKVLGAASSVARDALDE